MGRAAAVLVGNSNAWLWGTGEATVCGGELGGVNDVKIEAPWLAKPKWFISMGDCTFITCAGLVTTLSNELSKSGVGE